MLALTFGFFSAAQAQEITDSRLPPKDILIYLDNSKTIVGSKLRDDVPNELISEALTQILSYSEGDSRLVEPEDRISIYTFGDSLETLGEDIPGVNTAQWQAHIEAFGGGRIQRSEYTNFAEVLTDVAKKMGGGQRLDQRPFVVVIASDFVHEFDWFNVCNLRDEPFSDRSPVEQALDTLVTARDGWLARSGLPHFFALLPLDPESPYPASGEKNIEYGGCYEAVIEDPPIPRALVERLEAEQLNYRTLEAETERFVTDFARRYFESFASPTAVVGTGYELSDGGGLNLRLDVENRSSVAIDIMNVRLFSSDRTEIARYELQANERRLISEERRSVVFRLSDRQRRELFGPGSYLIEIDDEITRRTRLDPIQITAPAISSLRGEGAPELVLGPDGRYQVVATLVNESVRDNRAERAVVSVQAAEGERSFELAPEQGQADVPAGQRREIRFAFNSQVEGALVAARATFSLSITDRSSGEPSLLMSGSAQSGAAIVISSNAQVRGDDDSWILGRPDGSHDVSLRLTHSGVGLPVEVDRLRFFAGPTGSESAVLVGERILKSPVILVPGDGAVSAGEGGGNAVAAAHVESFSFDKIDSSRLLVGSAIRVEALNAASGEVRRVSGEGATLRLPDRQPLIATRGVQGLRRDASGRVRAFLRIENRGRIANRLLQIQAQDPAEDTRAYPLVLEGNAQDLVGASSDPREIAVIFDLDDQIVSRLLASAFVSLEIIDQSSLNASSPGKKNIFPLNTGEKTPLEPLIETIEWKVTADGHPQLTFQLQNDGFTSNRLQEVKVYGDSIGGDLNFNAPQTDLIIPSGDPESAEDRRAVVTFDRPDRTLPLALNAFSIRLVDGTNGEPGRAFTVSSPPKIPLVFDKPSARVEQPTVRLLVRNESSFPNTVRAIRLFVGPSRDFDHEIPIDEPLVILPRQSQVVPFDIESNRWQDYSRRNGFFVSLTDDSAENAGTKANPDLGYFVRLDSIKVAISDFNVQHYPNEDEEFRISLDLNLDRQSVGTTALNGEISLVDSETNRVIQGPVGFDIDPDVVRAEGYFVFQIARPEISLDRVKAVVVIPDVEILETKSIDSDSFIEWIKLNVLTTYLVSFSILLVCSVLMLIVAIRRRMKKRSIGILKCFNWEYVHRADAVSNFLAIFISGAGVTAFMQSAFGEAKLPYGPHVLYLAISLIFVLPAMLVVLCFNEVKNERQRKMVEKKMWQRISDIRVRYWAKAISIGVITGFIASAVLFFLAAPIADMDEVNPIDVIERFEDL